MENRSKYCCGATIGPIADRYTFTSFDGKNAEIDYSKSEGNKMKFRATKE